MKVSNYTNFFLDASYGVQNLYFESLVGNSVTNYTDYILIITTLM